jgi:hypothetical protein
MDVEHGGGVLEAADRAQQAVQVRRHVRHHAEERRGAAHRQLVLLG